MFRYVDICQSAIYDLLVLDFSNYNTLVYVKVPKMGLWNNTIQVVKSHIVCFHTLKYKLSITSTEYVKLIYVKD